MHTQIFLTMGNWSKKSLETIHLETISSVTSVIKCFSSSGPCQSLWPTSCSLPLQPVLRILPAWTRSWQFPEFLMPPPISYSSELSSVTAFPFLSALSPTRPIQVSFVPAQHFLHASPWHYFVINYSIVHLPSMKAALYTVYVRVPSTSCTACHIVCAVCLNEWLMKEKATAALGAAPRPVICVSATRGGQTNRVQWTAPIQKIAGWEIKELFQGWKWSSVVARAIALF